METPNNSEEANQNGVSPSYKFPPAPNPTFYTNPLAGRTPIINTNWHSKSGKDESSIKQLNDMPPSLSQEPTLGTQQTTESILANPISPLKLPGVQGRRRSVSFTPTPMAQAGVSSIADVRMRMKRRSSVQEISIVAQQALSTNDSGSSENNFLTNSDESGNSRLSQIARSKSTPGIAAVPRPEALKTPAVPPNVPALPDGFAGVFANNIGSRQSIMNLSNNGNVAAGLGSSHLMNMNGSSMHLNGFRSHIQRSNLISIVPQKSTTKLSVANKNGSPTGSQTKLSASEQTSDEAAAPLHKDISPQPTRKSIKVPVFPQAQQEQANALSNKPAVHINTSTAAGDSPNSTSAPQVPLSPTVAPANLNDDTSATVIPPPRPDLDESTLIPSNPAKQLDLTDATLTPGMATNVANEAAAPPEKPAGNTALSGGVSVAERKKQFAENLMHAIKAGPRSSALERASTLDNSQCSPGSIDRLSKIGLLKSAVHGQQVHEQFVQQQQRVLDLPSPSHSLAESGNLSPANDSDGENKPKPRKKLGIQVLPQTHFPKDVALRPVSQSFSGGQLPNLQQFASNSSFNNFILEKPKLNQTNKNKDSEEAISKAQNSASAAQAMNQEYARILAGENITAESPNEKLKAKPEESIVSPESASIKSPITPENLPPAQTPPLNLQHIAETEAAPMRIAGELNKISRNSLDTNLAKLFVPPAEPSHLQNTNISGRVPVEFNSRDADTGTKQDPESPTKEKKQKSLFSKLFSKIKFA